jgi:hypothetical protein
MLMVRYCYCCDHKDWDAWETLFTPDAVFDESEANVARHPATNEKIACPNYSIEFLEGMTAVVDWPLIGREVIRRFCENLSAENRMTHHVSSRSSTSPPTLPMTLTTSSRSSRSARGIQSATSEANVVLSLG